MAREVRIGANHCKEEASVRGFSPPWLSVSFSLLLSLVAASLFVGPISCSSEKCEYNKIHTLANCSDRRLQSIPWSLHKNIHILDMSNNFLPVLANQSFINYAYIRELILRNNSLQMIEERAFQRLTNLRVLDLSNNLLNMVPAAALRTVKMSLVQLIISGNKIYHVPKGSFSQLVNLKHLDLSGNSISKIESGALANLRAMEVFKANRNALQSLPHDAFEAFPLDSITQVQLYDNLWFCDCRLRWLRRWFNSTDPSVWDAPGYPVRCDGPAIVRDKAFASLRLDELACEIQMKSSSSTLKLAKGANQTLMCKYSSTPAAEAHWLVNSKVLDTADRPNKFSIESYLTESYSGETTQVSKLRIQNFRYEDIAKYECFVENIRGAASTEYRLTLEGVEFKLLTPAGSSTSGRAEKAGVDIRGIIIAVAVVSGIILLVAIAVLIFCSVNRMQRKKQEKQEAIRENVKQHFINNSEIPDLDASKLSNGTTAKPPLEDHLDSKPGEDRGSNSDRTNDSNITTLKRPLDLDETEPLYIFEQPGSPFTNGNTYVSFGSELTDPVEEYSPPLSGAIPPQGPTPHHGYPARHPSSRYESSHAGSATPLLERYTPSVFDSDEPVEDYAQYPVYDSLTNSLQHPPHVHNNHTHNRHPSDINNGFYSLVNTSSPAHRNDSASSYSSSGDPVKRLSSFHYPSSTNGSMPRTPGSTRSTLALAPRHVPADSYASDGNPQNDLADIYGYHGRNGTADMYGYHRPVPINPTDYRDPRYPATLPHNSSMTPDQKSMSVGNLGFSPLTPASSGPRKPPRLHQSREYMELTPQESAGGEYITSPEAQQYSQSYGITPGTPV